MEAWRISDVIAKAKATNDSVDSLNFSLCRTPSLHGALCNICEEPVKVSFPARCARPVTAPSRASLPTCHKARASNKEKFVDITAPSHGRSKRMEEKGQRQQQLQT